MGSPNTGVATDVKLSIEDMDVAYAFARLEWKAVVNNGYVVRARLHDPYFNLLKDVMDQHYLKKARNEPVKVTFSFSWVGPDEVKTDTRIAYMTNLYSKGEGEYGWIEFIAIDPPTWLLSRGKSSGKYYEGSISDVIRKVCQENGVSDVEISKTIDNIKGAWWMMRQDPKTFILSLLDWSSAVTQNKTRWVVNPRDMKLVIKEEYDLTSKDLGLFRVSAKDSGADDCENFEVLFDNFTHVLHAEEHTAGMSAVSGYYIDTNTEEEKAKVYDKNTGNKSNTKFGMDRGLKVTNKKFSTFVTAIPEESAGNVGINYKDYIDGRARREFLNMQGFITRMRMRVIGDSIFDDPTDLGVSTVTLQWIGADSTPYFLSGHWMINGFYHILDQKFWYTNIFINRLDYDAAAKKVGPDAR